MVSPKLREYFQTADLTAVLRELGAQNPALLIREINHFTSKEAEKRDNIVRTYFGQDGIRQIVDAIVTHLTSKPKLSSKAQILDVGAGSGFFTLKVAHRIKSLLPECSFYAMDVTPAMLLALAEKKGIVAPFFGIAENIAGSIQKAQEYSEIPRIFDAVFSTLMLHHCVDITKVFRSLRSVLKHSGKAVVVDLCTHAFTEFREEMGDIHLGFEPQEIQKKSQEVFRQVSVEKLAGICCSSSGRCAELFIATMKL